MTMPEPDPKLKAGKFKDLLRYLGPGIIVASASIGNGEIFFASREGSLFGFSLLWTFLLCAIMKGSVVYVGSKFATLTGEHPAARWGQIIPGSKNWVPVFLGIVAAIAIPSSICGFIKVLGQWTCWTFGIDTAYTVLCGTIWALVGFLFVFFSYEKMEKVSTGIVLILVIFALLAIFVSNPDWLALLSGFIPTIPAQYPDWVQAKNPEVLSGPILLEIVSAVGILGGGIQDYLGYMGTISEKNWGMYGNEHIADIQASLKRLSGKEDIPLPEDKNTVSNAKGWLKAVKIDNVASFTAVWLVGSIFMILGNVILGTNGLQVVPSNDQIIQNQANFFSVIFMGIDEYGEELVLWDYPIDIIPLFPALSSINLISIPLIYSQIYQRFKQKKFIYAVLISSAVICFVAEPLLTFFGYYDLINWHYYESYPIYVVVTLCTKGIVQKIMYISNKSSCIRNAG